MGRSRGVRPAGRRRQRVEWTGGQTAIGTSVSAAASVALGSSIITLLTIDNMTSPTLVRVRGELTYFVDAGSNGDQAVLGFGIAVVNRRASDVGSTALPRPLDEMDYSWLWHSMNFFRRSTAVDANTPVMTAVRLVIDSKAMRKVLSKEEEIVYVAQSKIITGTLGVLFAVQTRLLFKET